MMHCSTVRAITRNGTLMDQTEQWIEMAMRKLKPIYRHANKLRGLSLAKRVAIEEFVQGQRSVRRLEKRAMRQQQSTRADASGSDSSSDGGSSDGSSDCSSDGSSDGEGDKSDCAGSSSGDASDASGDYVYVEMFGQTRSISPIQLESLQGWAHANTTDTRLPPAPPQPNSDLILRSLQASARSGLGRWPQSAQSLPPALPEHAATGWHGP